MSLGRQTKMLPRYLVPGGLFPLCGMAMNIASGQHVFQALGYGGLVENLLEWNILVHASAYVEIYCPPGG